MADKPDKTKARILVIDDDASVRDSMVDALAGEGYDCTGAEDGSLGLARVADTRPQLIIVDILLPKLSGFELVATLRSKPATRLIPVVIVTALADRPCGRQATVLGFAGWRFDVARRRLFAASGGGCRLTNSEARLLHTLLDNPNQVLTRQEILEHLARSLSSPFDRSVDVLVARLRRKIEADRKRPQIIETVRGVGYVLNAQVESVGPGTGGEK